MAHPGQAVEVGGVAVEKGDFLDGDGDSVFGAHGFDFGGPAVGEEVFVEVGLVVVGVVGHEGDGEVGEGVVAVVEGRVVGLDAGRVVGDELYEAVDEVGEEDGEEDGGADEGSLGGDGVVFGDGDEGEDVYFPEEPDAEPWAFVGDERL